MARRTSGKSVEEHEDDNIHINKTRLYFLLFILWTAVTMGLTLYTVINIDWIMIHELAGILPTMVVGISLFLFVVIPVVVFAIWIDE